MSFSTLISWTPNSSHRVFHKGNRIRSWIVFLPSSLLCTACISSTNNNLHLGALCGEPNFNRIQIISSSLDAGTRTRNAYRITDKGDLSYASWTDGNQLLFLGETINIGLSAWSDALTVTKSLAGKEIDQTDDSPTSQAVQTIEFSLTGISAESRFVYQDFSTETVDAMLERWDLAIQRQVPALGTWLWTMPLPASASGEADLIATKETCTEQPVQDLDIAARGVNVVIPAPIGVERLITSAQSSKVRLTAHGPYGELWFGRLESP